MAWSPTRGQLTLPCPLFERPATVEVRLVPAADDARLQPAEVVWCSQFGNTSVRCPGRCLGSLPPTSN